MDGGGRSAGDLGIVDGETILVIHDDADADTVTKEAVSAIREVARTSARLTGDMTKDS
jgi:hypothetical protein